VRLCSTALVVVVVAMRLLGGWRFPQLLRTCRFLVDLTATHRTRGYKDGLQPESLADGNWLEKQNQPVSKIETISDTNLRSLYES
jgi:hypothetical protein